MRIPKPPRPAVLLPLMLLLSPVLLVLIGRFWVIMFLGNLVMLFLAWPFRILGGLAYTVLGGGR